MDERDKNQRNYIHGPNNRRNNEKQLKLNFIEDEEPYCRAKYKCKSPVATF